MSTSAADKAETEAAAWHARLSRPSVTTQAIREFRAWRADAENAEAYARVTRAWDTAGALAFDPEIRGLTQATLQRRPAPGRWRSRLRAPALALVTAAAFGGLGGWLLLQQRGASYTTGVGEQRLVVLEDGSRLRLNTDTAVRIRFTGAERHVDLTRGEAFFEVAHNPARPFVVTAQGARVQALGTRFDVRREPAALQVILLEGRLRIDQDRRPPALLAPNQALTVSARGISAPRAADARAAAGWTTGRLTFEGEPLEAAVAEVNRYTARKIVLAAPPQIAQRPVSGVFDIGDTGAFVAAAGSLLDLDARPQGDGTIRLAPRAAATPSAIPAAGAPAAAS